jgi:hypothetical protein
MAKKKSMTRSRKGAMPAEGPGAARAVVNSHKNRFVGEYSFRFSGFGRGPQAESFYVAGVGRMTLKAHGILTGSQFSSECPMTNGLTGNPPQFLHSEFDLSGTYAIGRDGAGTASVSFSKDGKVVQTDVFQLVATDVKGTRFWLISTKPTVSDFPVPELVSGEVVRLSSPSSRTSAD